MSSTPLVAFVIPTIGRKSLATALASLVDQTDPDWMALVVFDGVYPDKSVRVDDPRVVYVRTRKKGTFGQNHGNAGRVRNVALENHKLQGVWIGFLDDDDILLPEYVSNLRREASEHDPDVIITRMHIGDRIIPAPGMKDFQKNDVGISFAAKSHVFKRTGYRFIQADSEDFQILDSFRSNGLEILISNYVGYQVSPSQPDVKEPFSLGVCKPSTITFPVLILCLCSFLTALLIYLLASRLQRKSIITHPSSTTKNHQLDLSDHR